LNYSVSLSQNVTANFERVSARAFLLMGILSVLLTLGGCSIFDSRSVSISTPPSIPGELPRPTNTIDTLGLVAYATSLQGKPYRAGGASPAEGFDCSGLVHHVFRQFQYVLPRSASAMAAALPMVPLAEIEAADLIFFNTQGASYSHVGIYLGEGRFVHAPSPKTGRVIISEVANAYWRMHVSGARRPGALHVAMDTNTAQ
jgi:cell wall-associated NlpC family hydrolase